MYKLIIIFLLYIIVKITKLKEWASIDKSLSVVGKRITMVVRIKDDH